MGKALTSDVEEELQKLLVVDKLRRREGWYETRELAWFRSSRCCRLARCHSTETQRYLRLVQWGKVVPETLRPLSDLQSSC
jgi:hypothetical protein